MIKIFFLTSLYQKWFRALCKTRVPDYALVVGNPARQIGWMCKCGERLGDDLVCPVCGAVYQESEKGLEPVESLQVGAEDVLDTEAPF